MHMHPERLTANSDTPGRPPSAWYALAWVGEPRCSSAIRASIGTQDFLSGGRRTFVGYVERLVRRTLSRLFSLVRGSRFQEVRTKPVICPYHVSGSGFTRSTA